MKIPIQLMSDVTSKSPVPPLHHAAIKDSVIAIQESLIAVQKTLIAIKESGITPEKCRVALLDDNAVMRMPIEVVSHSTNKSCCDQ